MKSTEAKIGAFVVASAMVLCVTVFLVSRAKSGGATVAYHTYLRDAQGIEPGTAVMFGGITVGKITAVKSDSVDRTRIRIAFVVRQETPLNEESIAQVGTVSLMSSPVLLITTGLNSARRLAPGSDVRSRDTVSIAELQSKLGEIADQAQPTILQLGTDLHGVAGDAHKLLTSLNDVMSSANREHIDHTLANTESITGSLSPRVLEISEEVLLLTKNANALTAKMGATVETVNGTVSNANATITAFREPARADLSELKETLVQTNDLVRSLRILIATNTQNTNETIENLRISTENINELTESLKQRPWSLVRIKQPKDRKVPGGEGK